MKKTLNLICTVSFFSMILFSCGPSSDDKICYNIGYKDGKYDVENKEEKGCEGKLEIMAWNNMTGNQENKKRNFCEGYEDGYNRKPNKYPEAESKYFK